MLHAIRIYNQFTCFVCFRLRENYNALLARLEEIGDIRDTVIQEIGKIMQENRSLMGEISELKAEVKKLARDKAKRKRLR
jgi:seryl-tRNA synthetase